MRRTLASLALLFAWLCANGALLDATQAFAWARMFAGYTQTMTISEALRETFDPAKPCEMCLGVAKAKETQQKQLPPAVEQDASKFVLALHSTEAPVFANEPGDWLASPMANAPQRTESVPVPPPRV